MRDAVTEIAIDNPVAKEAFIRWWRTMEAQGYQYGFEALCNVWVGFDDGRADLARQLIEAADEFFGGLLSTHVNKIELLTALRAKCKELGVELPADNDAEEKT